MIGIVEGGPDVHQVCNIETILSMLTLAGYSRPEAIKFFESNIRTLDNDTLYLWPN